MLRRQPKFIWDLYCCFGVNRYEFVEFYIVFENMCPYRFPILQKQIQVIK